MRDFKLPHDIRSFKQDDFNFIINSWLTSYREYSEAVRRIPAAAYFKGQAVLIKRLLARSDIIIACSKEDHDAIFGWIVHESGILHYMYVKSTNRSIGIGTSLIEAAFEGNHFNCSHETNRILFTYKKYNASYNPYLCMEVSA